MSCPSFIGTMPLVAQVSYAFAPNEDPQYIYAPRYINPASATRMGIGKYTFPDLNFVINRVPDLGFNDVVRQIAISPHKSGGVAFGDVDNDGDLAWVHLRPSGYRLYWLTAGAGTVSVLIDTPDDDTSIDVFTDPLDTNYMLIYVRRATSFNGFWSIQRLRWPIDAVDAASIAAVGEVTSPTYLNPHAELLDSGVTTVSLQPSRLSVTPDGALWGTTTNRSLWRWTRNDGWELILPFDSGTGIGISQVQRPLVPRPDSHVWTRLSTGGVLGDGVDIAPDGSVTAQPCMDEAFHPLLGPIGTPSSSSSASMQVSGVAMTPSAGLIAINYVQTLFGPVWALRSGASPTWKLGSVAAGL